MIDLRSLREDPARVRRGLEVRGAEIDLDELLQQDATRRGLIQQVDEMKNRRNVVSKDIGARKRAGEDVGPIAAEMKELGRRITGGDAEVRALEESIRKGLLTIPNPPHASVPVGKDESANREVRRHGEPREFAFTPLPHWDLAESLGLIDFERAARMTGSGFPLFLGAGARLERGLIQFMLDVHTRDHGYLEMSTPFLCNTEAMTGTGQLPKMAEDMYGLDQDGLYLIPTAEVPITNYHREEIIEQALPLYYTGYTPCFRREAGAAGRDTRGLNRVHQFDKVEMVKFVDPATSYQELEALVGDAEDILKRLELPYRVLELCTGDLSFAAAKCYDIELWASGQDTWLEVSSCSNFEDFQARRANIRYRDSEGKPAHVHTLNGSGVALPRLVVALLENGQQADGSIVLPNVLHPYMGGMERIEPAV